HDDGRTQLTPVECSRLMECFYIPIDYGRDPDVALISSDTDVPPVAIRMQRDARFGPYIAFASGREIEWVANSSRAVDLPPLNRYLARQLVQRSTMWRRVLSSQVSPAALELLYEALERVSDMVCELPQLESLSIDPLYTDDRLM